MVDVVIVGGGIAGLATAYELSRRGRSFIVLERAPRAGGVILSEEIDGYTIDGGPDALLVQKPDGVMLCEEIGIGDRLVPTRPPRLAYIQRGRRLHALPAASVLGIPTRVAPFLRTSLFSWHAKARMAAELVVPARRDGGDESIGAFMRRRFGGEAVTYLAEPLLAGIHAGDVDRLSLHALFPRFSDAEQTHGSLLRAFRRRAHGPVPVDGAFKSLPGGLSEMVRALERALPAGSIRTGAAVTRIIRSPSATSHEPSRLRSPENCASSGEARRSADGAKAAAISPDARIMFRVETTTGEPFDAASVVLATPAYVTAALVRGRDAGLAQLCDEVPYASTATIALAFKREAVTHPLNGSGFVVPRVEKTGILAASWLSSKWPHRAPAGRVLMRTFVGGARDPQALEQSDEALIARSMNALNPLLGIRAEPLFGRVYRWERASAQHEVGHLTRLAAIEQALTRHPGLYVTGSGFRGVGIPDCVADGRATGRAVAAWLKDPQILRS